MKNICVSIGHSAVVGGAFNQKFGVNEYQLAKPICEKVVSELNAKLKPSYQAIIIDAGNLQQYASFKVRSIDVNNPVLAMELHFNSFEGNAKVMPSHPLIVHWGTNERTHRFANILIDEFDDLYKDKKWSKGQVVSLPADGYDLDRYWLIHNTRAPTMIVEAFFMRNNDQVAWMVNDPAAKDSMAKALTDGIVKCVLDM